MTKLIKRRKTLVETPKSKKNTEKLYQSVFGKPSLLTRIKEWLTRPPYRGCGYKKISKSAIYCDGCGGNIKGYCNNDNCGNFFDN